jgi:peptide/nickel transport system ATP-binding protein
MTTLNPVFTIGKQLDEAIKYHTSKLAKKDIAARSIEMLKTVGIANAEGVYKMYPHELSGGMRQRVVIAMALACQPQLIIADEPTTALDVTIQAQILDLLRNLKSKINASIMLITHDLGVVAETADYVVVMYAGRIVEKGTVQDIFHHPSHPYTLGLMKSRPNFVGENDRLYSIPGSVPNPVDLPNYCFFRNRCEKACEACAGPYPKMTALSETHQVACYLYDGENQKEGDVDSGKSDN